MNLLELRTQAMPAFYEAKQALQIVGAPGMGKTDAVDAFCEDMSKRTRKPFGLVTAILSGKDPVDMRGVLIPMKHPKTGEAIVRGTVPDIWPSEFNVEVFVNGEKLNKEESIDHIKANGVPANGILFADEFSQADLDIQKVFAQVLLDRRMGEHVLLDGWGCFVAGNRSEDRAGVVKTLSHVQNRMCQIEVVPDYEAWQAWAFQKAIHPLIISFAKAHAGDVFRLSVPKEPGPYCTPRSLVMCANLLETMRTPKMNDHQLPDDHIATEIASGYMGEGVAPKFMSHLRLANDLPDVDDVIKAPMKAKVPERLDAKFVMSTSLSAHANTAAKLKPILQYMQRIDQELQVLFVQSVVKRSPAALTTPEFSQWVQKNQKLVMATHVG